jgi:FimV-like protein
MGGRQANSISAISISTWANPAETKLELDEVGTKLDLARAYLEMGDKEGAREILNEVLAEGNDSQKGRCERHVEFAWLNASRPHPAARILLWCGWAAAVELAAASPLIILAVATATAFLFAPIRP